MGDGAASLQGSSQRGEHDPRVTSTPLILIEHGSTVELEHAASLSLCAELRRMVELDPDILKRPKVMKALMGGTATKESPLQAARRRGRTEIVS
jgi:hypothetical protein